MGVANTLLDGYNPISNGNPSTAYSAFSGGIQRAVGSTLTFGSIEGVVLLDLYRVSKTSGTNGTSGTLWHNANSITSTYSDNTFADGNSARADYLGTIGIAANGDVNFAAVPEPSTYALIALTGALYFFVNRRRKTLN